MELSDFIQKSLQEIVEAIEHSETKMHSFELAKDMGVEFDVAVSSGSSSRVKSSITVLSARSRTAEEKIHRLRFRLHPKIKKYSNKK